MPTTEPIKPIHGPDLHPKRIQEPGSLLFSVDLHVDCVFQPADGTFDGDDARYCIRGSRAKAPTIRETLLYFANVFSRFQYVCVCNVYGINSGDSARHRRIALLGSVALRFLKSKPYLKYF